MPALRAHPLSTSGPIRYLCIAALLLLQQMSVAQDYTMTKLPLSTQPVAINSSGQVTGGTTQTGHDSSFFWTRAGGLHILPDLGGGATRVHAMNDSGAVVGESSLANFKTHAFLWTQAGGIQDLGSPQGGNSAAVAINAAGEVAGYSATPDSSAVHAFYWSPGTGAVDLGTINSNTSSPLGIADTGEIVGYQFTNNFSAFRWTLAGGMEVLPDLFLPANLGTTHIVNDDGLIAGLTATGHAALFDGTVQDLGTLPPDTSSVSLFINGAGHIVGTSRDRVCCGHERTFFWTPAGMVDIGLLPKHTNGRSIPLGFNKRDQVVGTNGATYFWSPTSGLRQIPVISLKYTPPFASILNDAGQMLGSTSSASQAIVASPTMHVSVSSSQNPSLFGQPVTFTASVSSIAGLPPDGEQVTFKDGSMVLGTATLSNGSASFTTSSLKAKTHAVSAQYSGDDNYLPSKPTKLSQVVNP
jgi:probable HAF family extracellular repeat protein